MDITQFLAFTIKMKGSDLHLHANLPPMVRVAGDLRRMNLEPLRAEEVLTLVYDIMTDQQREDFKTISRTNFTYEILGLERFRVTLFMHARGPSAIFSRLAFRVLTLNEIGASNVLKRMCRKSSGLIAVSGKYRSGRTTTISAMVGEINESEYVHICIVEKSTETFFESKRSLITQIEYGDHANAHASALQAAIDSNSDVIITGELRDVESTRLALLAAEAGHLVIVTVSTTSAIGTIQRLVGLFSNTEQVLMRNILSDTLLAVVSQWLLPSADESGRVLANEVLVNTPSTRTLIRQDKLDDLYANMESGSAFGMATLDQALFNLVRSGEISFRTARAIARYPENFGPQTSKAKKLNAHNPLLGFFIPLGSNAPEHYYQQNRRVQR